MAASEDPSICPDGPLTVKDRHTWIEILRTDRAFIYRYPTATVSPRIMSADPYLLHLQVGSRRGLQSDAIIRTFAAHIEYTKGSILDDFGSLCEIHPFNSVGICTAAVRALTIPPTPSFHLS